MPKVTVQGGPSNAAAEREMHGIEHPADGTLSPEISNDPAAEDPAAEPAKPAKPAPAKPAPAPRPRGTSAAADAD